jgi:hypothetical protein
MLTDRERQWIYQRAYVPEHLPDYVGAISGAESFLYHRYLFFVDKKHLFFNGYPLEPDSEPGVRIYDLVCKRFQPTTAAVIAPSIWLPRAQCKQEPADRYYQLKLPLPPINAANAYMLRRASRDIQVTHGSFGRTHRKVVNAFLNEHRFDQRQKSLFQHISHYLKGSPSTVLLEAKLGKELAAFNIVDLGSQDYAFYLFSFRSNSIRVPGASDLLFYEMAQLAQAEGKKAVNLGLGIHTGIRRFKEKWGGIPFLEYHSMSVDKRQADIGELAKKL